ncbi:hypothetical protein POM88_017131 [Heracleum sosnowskyi]|uniref:Uncharacterized protein n=1 Tax=Heracleum sosnowskyi TaxID=360622 RepID=A0AAD8MZ40_9APIA|nr:hypothetical protein POM88_017131 [Heracleum sosnowskyi]
MVDDGPLSSLPKEDFIKVNVLRVFSEEPLENGNTSGIGIIFRNDRGTIIRIKEINRLATYLAEHGACTWDRMVELEAPFGRGKEIWYKDTGLGPIGPKFETLRELDLAVVVVNKDGGILEDEEMV